MRASAHLPTREVTMGRLFIRNQAITAMVLAERVAAG